MAQAKSRITQFVTPPRRLTINPVRQRDGSSRIAEIIPQEFDQSELLSRWKRPQFVGVYWHKDSPIGFGIQRPSMSTRLRTQRPPPFRACV